MIIDLEAARLGARIRRRREQLQLSVAEVARAAGFDEATIFRLETGEGGRIHTLLCVLQVLEVKVKMRQLRKPDGGPPNSAADSSSCAELRA